MTSSNLTPSYAPSPRWMSSVLAVWAGAETALNALQPLALLMARLYVAQVFFASGLTKLRDWGTTVALFTDEYHVPFLPPELAAVMGTTGELVLPVLLVLGLVGRFAALGLSVVNAVAVISLTELAAAAMQQHTTWGIVLAGLAVFGCGRWALDTPLRSWIEQR